MGRRNDFMMQIEDEYGLNLRGLSDEELWEFIDEVGNFLVKRNG